MSTNRTVVELVAVEAVACAEAADLALDLLLLGLEPGELRPAPDSERRYSPTSALTEVPRSAARILALR